MAAAWPQVRERKRCGDRVKRPVCQAIVTLQLFWQPNSAQVTAWPVFSVCRAGTQSGVPAAG